MQWFIKEQIEEVASMNDLLKVVGRSNENPLLAEEYLARESPRRGRTPPPRPSPAAPCNPSARPPYSRDRARPHPHRRRPCPRSPRLGVAPREELIARHAAGRSFVDVGCMWTIHGALCFAAEDAGAARVTGVDVMGATDRFRAELARRGSKVRFVQGDLHDPATIAAVGPHDVVWCSGVLYHAPHPLLTLQRLRELTAGTLLLATETVAETAGGAARSSSRPAPRSIPMPSPRAAPTRATGPGTGGSRPRRCARCSRWPASPSTRSTARRFT